MHVCMHACMHTCICVCICMDVHMHVSMYMHMCVSLFMLQLVPGGGGVTPYILYGTDVPLE